MGGGKKNKLKKKGGGGGGGGGGQKAPKSKKSEATGADSADPMMMDEVVDDLEELEMEESGDSQTDVLPQVVSQETLEEGEKEEVKSKLTAAAGGRVDLLPVSVMAVFSLLPLFHFQGSSHSDDSPPQAEQTGDPDLKEEKEEEGAVGGAEEKKLSRKELRKLKRKVD